ncbi:unnamed protein product [Amoebophrya sp. A120]|nr:unnamed protein product [Amoebophrya sp. A120]|eukprot:GSA120T00018390001.1
MQALSISADTQPMKHKEKIAHLGEQDPPGSRETCAFSELHQDGREQADPTSTGGAIEHGQQMSMQRSNGQSGGEQLHRHSDSAGSGAGSSVPHPHAGIDTGDVGMMPPAVADYDDNSPGNAAAPQDSTEGEYETASAWAQLDAILEQLLWNDMVTHRERLAPGDVWSPLFRFLNEQANQELQLEYRVVLQQDGTGPEKASLASDNEGEDRVRVLDGQETEVMQSEPELQRWFAAASGTFVDGYIAQNEQMDNDYAEYLKDWQSQWQGASRQQLVFLHQSHRVDGGDADFEISRIPFRYEYSQAMLQAAPAELPEDGRVDEQDRHREGPPVAYLHFRVQLVQSPPQLSEGGSMADDHDDDPDADHHGPSGPSSPGPVSPNDSSTADENKTAALVALKADFEQFLNTREGSDLKTEGECGNETEDEAISNPLDGTGRAIRWHWLDADSENNTCGMNALLASSNTDRNYEGKLKLPGNPRRHFASKIRELCLGNEANLGQKLREVLDHPAHLHGGADDEDGEMQLEVAERVERMLLQINVSYQNNIDQFDQDHGHNIHVPLLEYDSVQAGHLQPEELHALQKGFEDVGELHNRVSRDMKTARDSVAKALANGQPWDKLDKAVGIKDWTSDEVVDKIVLPDAASLLWDLFPPLTTKEEDEDQVQDWLEQFEQQYNAFVLNRNHNEAGKPPELFQQVWEGMEALLLAFGRHFPEVEQNLASTGQGSLLRKLAALVLCEARFRVMIGKGDQMSTFQIHRQRFAPTLGADASQDLFTLMLKQYLSYIQMPDSAVPLSREELELPRWIALLMDGNDATDLASVFAADHRLLQGKRTVCVEQSLVREAMAKWRYANGRGIALAQDLRRQFNREQQVAIRQQLNSWKSEVYQRFAGWKELQDALQRNGMYLVGYVDGNHFRRFVLA